MKTKHHKWKEVYMLPGAARRAWKCVDCESLKTQENYKTRSNRDEVKLRYTKDGITYNKSPVCAKIIPFPKVINVSNLYFHYNVLLESELGQKVAFSSDPYIVRLGLAEGIGSVNNLRTDGPKLYGDLVLSRPVTGLFPTIHIQVLEWDVLFSTVKEVNKANLIAVCVTTEPNIDPSIRALL